MNVTGAGIEERARALAQELRLCAAEAVLTVASLEGGVASDIAMVDLGHTRVCMKFALPKLKTALDWFAPLHRNAAEYAWLSVVAQQFPENAPALFGRSAALSGFAMEFIDGADVYLWKQALLDEAPIGQEARRVGDLLGRVHQASTAPGFATAPFNNMQDFAALRIDPYLRFTATRHPGVAARLTQLADGLATASTVLVHGDVSPKNIMFRGAVPVILDAECATMGDASFDPAFCVNHLVLKAIHLPGSRRALLQEVLTLWQAYASHISWEPVAGLEARIAHLLPALMLARVDGISPVEYLTEDGRGQVRSSALGLLNAPQDTLAAVVEAIERAIANE